MVKRIDWSELGGATHGLVGAVQRRLFKIIPMGARPNGVKYRLETSLPVPQLTRPECEFASQEAAKAGAERILAAFVEALGAEFKGNGSSQPETSALDCREPGAPPHQNGQAEQDQVGVEPAVQIEDEVPGRSSDDESARANGARTAASPNTGASVGTAVPDPGRTVALGGRPQLRDHRGLDRGTHTDSTASKITECPTPDKQGFADWLEAKLFVEAQRERYPDGGKVYAYECDCTLIHLTSWQGAWARKRDIDDIF